VGFDARLVLPAEFLRGDTRDQGQGQCESHPCERYAPSWTWRGEALGSVVVRTETDAVAHEKIPASATLWINPAWKVTPPPRCRC